jgi:hypothetical protein
VGVPGVERIRQPGERNQVKTLDFSREISVFSCSHKSCRKKKSYTLFVLSVLVARGFKSLDEEKLKR